MRDAKWYADNAIPTTREGVNPFFRYVIREPGKSRSGSVVLCDVPHSSDERWLLPSTVHKATSHSVEFMPLKCLSRVRYQMQFAGWKEICIGAPWISPDPQEGLWSMPIADLAAAHASVPPGVVARHRSSPHSPVVVPDLFGLQSRDYLDRTGLQHHRGIQDLMRYVALNQGMDGLSQFDDFVPAGKDFSTATGTSSLLLWAL